MLVSFVAAGSAAWNNTTNSQSLTAPACRVDDILIACLITKSLSNAIAPPDDTWEEVTQSAMDGSGEADDFTCAVYAKRATASGGSFTFTKDSDDNELFGGVIVAYRGVKKRGVIVRQSNTYATQDPSANITFQAFNPIDVRSEIVFVGFYGDDQTTMAAAMSGDTNPDCTIRADVETSIGSDATIAITSGPTTDGSNIASRTWATSATANSSSMGIVFELIPEARKMITSV